MSSPLDKLDWKIAAPRILIDFAIVHVTMLVAIVASILYHLATGEGVIASDLIQRCSGYYFPFFWPLSLLFPVVFYLNGFYTRAPAYRGRLKALVVLRGVGTTILLFVAANFFVFPKHLVPRSAGLVFCVLLMFSLTLARFFKAFFTKRFDITPKKTASEKRTAESEVLVVGGAGYIGSILVRKLLAAGHRVRILDNLVYGDDAIQDVVGHPNLELIVGDCRNIQSVVAAIKNVGSIIHLAAIVGDPACERDHRAALEINYAATRMMIEIAKGHGVQRFVFASSCSVYGAAELTMDENSTVAPISLYGKTKVDSEASLLAAKSDTFHPTILRLATVFGNSYRPRFDLVVNLLTAKAFKEGVITIYNGEQWRPFIHVEDVAEGLKQVLEAPLSAVSGEIFNLGDSRLNYTLSNIAEHIRRFFPETRIEHMENSDRRNYRVSFDKIYRRLGFQCAVTLEEGIRGMKEAFESGAIADYTAIRFNNYQFLSASGSPENTNAVDSEVMAALAHSG